MKSREWGPLRRPVEAPRGKTVLRIESWSNAARVLFLRGLAAGLPFSFAHTTNADRSIKSEDFTINAYKLDMPEILSVQPETVPVRRGSCYVRITLLFEDAVIAILSSAYLTDSKGITWPPGVHEGSTEGPGYRYNLTGAPGFPGVEASVSVPPNTRWRVVAIRLALTTSAAVGDRGVGLRLSGGPVVTDYMVPDMVGQMNDTTVTYNWAIGGETRIGTVETLEVALKLPDMVFGIGGSITTDTKGMDIGDLFGASSIWVEEWIQE